MLRSLLLRIQLALLGATLASVQYTECEYHLDIVFFFLSFSVLTGIFPARTIELI
jgi:hypothetical protein